MLPERKQSIEKISQKLEQKDTQKLENHKISPEIPGKTNRRIGEEGYKRQYCNKKDSNGNTGTKKTTTMQLKFLIIIISNLKIPQPTKLSNKYDD